MCYYVDSKITKTDIKKIYNVGYEGKDFEGKDFLNGYSHLVAIVDKNPSLCCL